MCDRNGGRRLRQWLIEQIDSGMYPGLIWESEEKSMFRIPWKHAGKQDYNQEVDASIFKAWAVFKGKFKEGDKAEPATWKTRLRCALNKSPDFEEVTDRSQLDISEPYKVYRIVPEEEQKCRLGVATPGCVSEMTEMECGRPEMDELVKEPSVDDYMGIVKRSPSPPDTCRSQLLPECWMQQQPSAGLPLVTGYTAYDTHHSAFSQMVISFYYGGKLVGQTATTCPEGCRLSLGQPALPGAKLYGPEGLELVRFPPADAIPSERQRQVTRKLFGHLERGVLLHSSRQGVLVKRLCQGRVFCSGNAVLCKDRPNKLERDEVVKVFDTSQFFRELQHFYNNQGRLPDSRVVLCFGEEFPDLTPLRSKLILVQIEQLYVRQLVEEASKSCGGGSLAQTPEAPQLDQFFRMFPDVCTSHQRPFFRENQQITV
ncbi:interferon regulatory factor 8 isoform X1 [Mustela putorius furo]|uniref:Interferon regulatory factor 8 n=4 Tax=Mustela putorius furo TaxID=9669 RepID=A0A8U0UYV7_MUSPF|nr:interferon regulatory factor 8 isoform X1 [Mustela putorius furo]XP_044932504.1 interferon regulatory factor 8 isoform X1 [Mustela putorius furo]